MWNTLPLGNYYGTVCRTKYAKAGRLVKSPQAKCHASWPQKEISDHRRETKATDRTAIQYTVMCVSFHSHMTPTFVVPFFFASLFHLTLDRFVLNTTGCKSTSIPYYTAPQTIRGMFTSVCHCTHVICAWA